MTVNFKDNVQNLLGEGYNRNIFIEIPFVALSSDGESIIATDRVPIPVDANGDFTTPPFNYAGPAKVFIGTHEFNITLPDSGTDIRLWDRIFQGLGPPAAAVPQAVINLGGFAAGKWITAAEWADIAPGDPDTTYLVKP